MLSQKRDPPPVLTRAEKPTPEELSELAHKLLSEMARTDIALADRMRRMGIAPDWDEPTLAPSSQRNGGTD